MQFLEAGAHHRERLFIAGNRCGKTELSGYEISYHLTGKYPPSWRGKTFSHGVNA
jgi:hypothetical protein